jgi:hypothetical protein
MGRLFSGMLSKIACICDGSFSNRASPLLSSGVSAFRVFV